MPYTLIIREEALEEKIRDVKVKHFPYQVVYEIIENSVVVFSVFNSRQDPLKLKFK